jgi:hypothetical protein
MLLKATNVAGVPPAFNFGPPEAAAGVDVHGMVSVSGPSPPRRRPLPARSTPFIVRPGADKTYRSDHSPAAPLPGCGGTTSSPGPLNVGLSAVLGVGDDPTGSGCFLFLMLDPLVSRPASQPI